MERRQEIIEAIQQGRTYEDIGLEYGISRQRVQQIARKAGIRRRLPVTTEPVKPASLLERVRAFFGTS